MYTDFRKMLETRTSTRCRSPRRTTGTPCRRSGPARPARTSTSRSRARTTSSKSQQIVAAARKYNRIVQMGSQSRSSPALQEAVQNDARRRDRRDLHGARAVLQGARHHRQDARRAGARPASITTSGAARRRSVPFTQEPLPLQLALVLGHGNGDLGNQGIHEVDIARWGLGVTHPTKVSAIGGKFMFDDDQETPNTLNCGLRVQRRRQEEDDEFEVRHWISATTKPASPSEQAGQHDRQHLLRLEGLPGHRRLQQVLQLPGQGTAARADARPRADEHFANFIAAVRSRKREDLNAEIEEGAHVLRSWCTWPTSPTGWAARCTGMRRRWSARRRGSEPDADARLPQAVSWCRRRSEGTLEPESTRGGQSGGAPE